MKNSLSKDAIERIANNFALAWPDFAVDDFVVQAIGGVSHLALKMRVKYIIKVLAVYLPKDFERAVPILYKVKDVWIKGDETDVFQSFAAWPVIDYIAVYGIKQPDLALPLLKHLTGLFSAEFAIRPFIEKYPQLCHQYFLDWVTDPDEQVRRLVSEGARPRLPWANKLTLFIEQPHINLPLLAQLRQDPSLYVRRSVANHLNDIAKDNPQLVLDICEDWIIGANEEIKWVITHATRGLVKQGAKRVYALLGYTCDPILEELVLDVQTKQVSLGEKLQFTVHVVSCSDEKQTMVIDYALGFMKANGVCRDKVFKLKNLSLNPKQSMKIVKNHPIKPISTRRYYSGVQTLTLLINGKAVAKQEFELIF